MTELTGGEAIVPRAGRAYMALGTALGVKAANPQRAVLSVTGDGGFMFTMPELATAVQHRIATITVVFNDGAYGNVRRAQKDQYAGRIIASELDIAILNWL